MLAYFLRFAFAAILLICGGCTYRFRPVQLTVLQQSTSEPAVNVPVTVGYWIELLAYPLPVHGTTDENGHVELLIADFTHGGIEVILADAGNGPWGFIAPKQLEGGGWASPIKSDSIYRVQVTPVGPWQRHLYNWGAEKQLSNK